MSGKKNTEDSQQNDQPVLETETSHTMGHHKDHGEQDEALELMPDQAALELHALQDKIKILMKSLTTISEEKSGMESRFQADKKAVSDAHRLAISHLKQEVFP